MNHPAAIAPSKTTKTSATDPCAPDNLRAKSASPTSRATNVATRSALEVVRSAGSSTRYAAGSDSQAPTTVPKRSTAAVTIARPSFPTTQTFYATRSN